MRTVIVNRNSPGVIKDLPGFALPPEAWTRCENVRFRNGLGERFGGRVPLGLSIADTYQIFAFQPYGLDWHAIFAGTATLTISDGTTTTDITGATVPAADPNDWTFTNFNGIPVLNAPGIVPQALTTIPGGPIADLANWPATWLAASVRSYKNVLVAMNVTKGATVYPNLVATSSITDPGSVPASWDNTDPATLAFEDFLATSDDDDDNSIVDGLQLGDLFMIYKHTSATVMSVGGQNLYTLKKTFDKGALNRNCVVPLTVGDARHLVVGLDDIYLHNGYREESVIENRLRKWLFDQLDPTYYYLVHAKHNRKLSEVYVPFPASGSAYCNFMWVWNYKNGNQSIVPLDPVYSIAVSPFVVPAAGADEWESDELGWEDDDLPWDDSIAISLIPRILAAGSDGLYALDEAAPDMPSVYERQGLPLAGRDESGQPIFDTESEKQVKSMWPRFEGTGTGIFTLGTSKGVNEAVDWGTPVAFDIATESQVDVEPRSGRILHTRFEFTDTANSRFLGYDLDIEAVGEPVR